MNGSQGKKKRKTEYRRKTARKRGGWSGGSSWVKIIKKRQRFGCPKRLYQDTRVHKCTGLMHLTFDLWVDLLILSSVHRIYTEITINYYVNFYSLTFRHLQLLFPLSY